MINLKNEINMYIYVLVFVLIYISNSAVAVLYIPSYLRFLILVLFLIPILCRKNIKINKKILFFCFFMFVLQSITILFKGFNLSFDLFLIFSIMSALLFVNSLDKELFLKALKKVICFIAIISLLFFLLGLLFPSYMDFIPSFLKKSVPVLNSNALFGIFVSQIRTSLTYYRNFGIFLEPGQFQIFICLGLILELFDKENINAKRLLILVLSLISCNSTNGFIVAVFVFIAYIFNIKKSKNKKISYKNFTLICIISLLAFLILYFNQNIVQDMLSKIMEFSNDNLKIGGSGFERKRALQISLLAYKSSPIFGLGFTGFINFNSRGYITTFSPLNWFTLFGTLYGIIANISFLSFFNKFSNKKNVKLFLYIAALLMISAQSVNSDIFIWIIILYGVMSWEKRNKNEKSIN